MTADARGRDAMQFINEQDTATLERFIQRLEYRGTDPTFTAYRDAYLELLELPPTAAVLDLGCGTGVVARAIAARDGFTGTVTGVDQSPDFVAAAHRLAADEGVAERRVRPRRRARARPPGRELRRRRGAHPGQPRPRPACSARRGGTRRPPGRPRGGLRRRLRVADLRQLRSRARPSDGARDAVDDHERSAGHARAAAAAAAGRARTDRDAGPRVRGGRCEPLHAQLGRDLRPVGGVERARARRRRRGMARRPAPLRGGRHVLPACNYYAYVARAAT